VTENSAPSDSAHSQIKQVARSNLARLFQAGDVTREGQGRWIPAWVRAWPERWSLRLPDEAVENWIGNR
jgi:hypothetical protein